MSSLQRKRILLGVTAGVAAYKSPDLVRRLRDRGAEVRVVMSRNAEDFITALTLQAVSGHPVHRHRMDADSESGMGHIELARWADAVLVAPATANFIARLAWGLGDELLTTLCLATDAPVAIAPAMNQQMWRNPATQHNLELLAGRGVTRYGPAEGDQACGETGPGRMLEADQLAELTATLFEGQALSGVSILMTAGPTLEPLDPVRALTNHSSGRMGYALAEAAAENGAAVTLVSGPTTLPEPDRVRAIHVGSAREMYAEVMQNIAGQDIFIGVAAVADYRPAEYAAQKVKKTADELQLKLVKNPDILAAVAALDDPPFTVGFAAETQDMLANARKKLRDKGVDLIAANRVGDADSGFGDAPNAVTLINRDDAIEFMPADKPALARTLIKEIARQFDLAAGDRSRNLSRRA